MNNTLHRKTWTGDSPSICKRAFSPVGDLTYTGNRIETLPTPQRKPNCTVRSKKWSAQEEKRPRTEKRALFPGLRIARTSVGKGVFAARSFVDGEVVGEITGETIEDPDYTSRYAFDLENGSQLEPAAPFRFVNHSCDPNCSFQVLEIKHGTAPIRRQLMLFTIDDIRSGEELTIDYNWPASYAIPCKCGSSYCRGWIVGRNYMEEHRLDEPAEAITKA